MSSTIAVTSRHEIIVDCASCGAHWNRTRNSSRGRNRICDVCKHYFCRNCDSVEKCEVCRRVYCDECSAMALVQGRRMCFRCQPADLYFGPGSNLCQRCGSPDQNVRARCLHCRRRLKCACMFESCEFCGDAVCLSCPGENYFCHRCSRSGRFACTVCCIRHANSRNRR